MLMESVENRRGSDVSSFVALRREIELSIHEVVRLLERNDIVTVAVTPV